MMKMAKALHIFSEHVIPERGAEEPAPNENDLKNTLVLRILLSDPQPERHLQTPAYIRNYQIQSRGTKRL
jgi:hypothetical protein